MGGPETAELIEPVIKFAKGFRAETVKAALCVNRDIDEAGVTEDAEVLGDRGLREAELCFDVAYRLFGGGEETENRAAGGLSYDLEG